MHALCYVQNILLAKRCIKSKLQVMLWIKPHQHTVAVLFFRNHQ